MGVKGLSSLVRSLAVGEKKRVSGDRILSELPPVLLVDALSLNRVILEAVQKVVTDSTKGMVPFPELYGGGNSLFARALELFVLTLRKAGCEPVFYFDGVDIVKSATDFLRVQLANSAGEASGSKPILVTTV